MVPLSLLLCSRPAVMHVQPSGPVFSTTLKKKGHTTVSTDGWTLHLVHTTDTALAPEQRKQHPILMCPGLASSGPGTFDLVPKVWHVLGFEPLRAAMADMLTRHVDHWHTTDSFDASPATTTCCRFNLFLIGALTQPVDAAASTSLTDTRLE